MSTLEKLIANNRSWAAATEAREPGFFARLTAQQAPRYLWIGCSDSRVPANEIVGLLPGELFVHRNVGNVVVHTDLNCLSVLQYAIEVLSVEHVIVCGHYGCGGVIGAWQGTRLGLIENWLRQIQETIAAHRECWERLAGESDRIDRVCELNVLQGAYNVCRTTVVQQAWERGQPGQLLPQAGIGAQPAIDLRPLVRRQRTDHVGAERHQRFVPGHRATTPISSSSSLRARSP
jgi:carbonic anhydrase